MSGMFSNNVGNLTDLPKMLECAKEMGFKSVTVFDVSLLYDEGSLDDVLNVTRDMGFDVNLMIVWRDKTYKYTPDFTPDGYWDGDFPYNETQFLAFKDYLKNITDITRDFGDVKSYFLMYPYFNKTDMEERILHPNYKTYLQEFVYVLKNNDPLRKVFMTDDMVEFQLGGKYILPYDILAIDGYGISYYPHGKNTINEDAFKPYLNHYRKVCEKNLVNGKIFVSEWGFQKVSEAQAYASNETEKRRLIKEMVKMLYKHNIKEWGYFGLWDMPTQDNQDWGLIYNMTSPDGNSNWFIRESGLGMQEILNSKGIPINENVAFLKMEFSL